MKKRTVEAQATGLKVDGSLMLFTISSMANRCLESVILMTNPMTPDITKGEEARGNANVRQPFRVPLPLTQVPGMRL
jgi:GTP:adenosylcobinamide-phosphate guanylyltransferase